MIVYCDTSWLLSYLNEDDENHAVARAAAWSLSVGVFLTYDQRQGKVAGLMGMGR